MPDSKGKFAQRLKNLPERPGVYVMKDSDGNIIYVGKASSLKNRVRSYFQSPSNLSRRTQLLVESIADYEYIVTDSEVEALILENNLIKKYRPWFNVQFRDDKTYPFIKITMQEEFPRVIVTRKIEQDGSRYFGPYADVGAMRATLRFLRRFFPIRSCSRQIGKGFSKEVRPCLNYHIKKCLSPCSGKISNEAYMELINQIVLFLEGHHDQLINVLEKDMKIASDSLNFEMAASLRDTIKAMKRSTERQKIFLDSHRDIDVIGYFKDEGNACVQIFFVRSGKLIGRERFFMTNVYDVSDREIITAFMKQYYSEAVFIPDEVLSPTEPYDKEAIAMWLREKKGRKVIIHVPQRGDKKHLQDMATDNAMLNLEEEKIKITQRKGFDEAALLELMETLSLPGIPQRIEAFDISAIQGTDAVGGMVVFKQGQPDKSSYRRFKIKTVKEQDDYAMMHEIILRRYRRVLKQTQKGDLSKIQSKARNEKDKAIQLEDQLQPGLEGQAQKGLPDLIMIDGGKGHLNAGLQALYELGIGNVPIISLAESQELIFVKGKERPIILQKDSKALLLLRRIRDEAHRFAVSYHRQLRTKRSTLSALEDIPGIGKKRLQSLLVNFGSLASIRKADVKEIAGVPGMNIRLAERVKETLTQNYQ